MLHKDKHEICIFLPALDPLNLRLSTSIPPQAAELSARSLHGGAHVTLGLGRGDGEGGGRALFFLHSKAAGHVDPHAAAE